MPDFDIPEIGPVSPEVLAEAVEVGRRPVDACAYQVVVLVLGAVREPLGGQAPAVRP